ncbi:MAG: pyridoxamine 5'-phosphate oxidase family protein [Leptolyngbyaceae cyanobacterium]
MAIPGWTKTESPFHQGETAIHARFDAQDRVEQQGRRFIRTFMLEQHQQFFAQLPYAIVGTVDSLGHPWASILVGQPGFLSSPDAHRLKVAARPLAGDPLAQTLVEGTDIGLLGIELHTRRRNRLNGVVVTTTGHDFEIQVKQSFGNCPKYIQTRQFELVDIGPTPAVQEVTKLSAYEQNLITAADTFFIATAYQSESAGLASGVDVSHRGGKPGFVRIDPNDALTVPDFAGNFLFNTFGNIELNPRAGLLFIDFERGDLLYLTGSAKVIWEGPEISNYPGAERLLQLYPERGYRIESGLPLRWTPPQLSPFLKETGPW